MVSFFEFSKVSAGVITFVSLLLCKVLADKLDVYKGYRITSTSAPVAYNGLTPLQCAFYMKGVSAYPLVWYNKATSACNGNSEVPSHVFLQRTGDINYDMILWNPSDCSQPQRVYFVYKSKNLSGYDNKTKTGTTAAVCATFCAGYPSFVFGSARKCWCKNVSAKTHALMDDPNVDYYESICVT